MDYIRMTFLDASALLAWLLHPDIIQNGGDKIATYLSRPERQRYSNDLCLAEVFTRLKWMRQHEEITNNGYLMRIKLLQLRIYHRTLYISEFNYWKKEYMEKALDLVRKNKNKIDFIDAMQIIDVLEGPFRTLAGPSQTLLISTDRELVKVARIEGVDAWYPPNEKEPD